jgi:hypothetical protein
MTDTQTEPAQDPEHRAVHRVALYVEMDVRGLDYRDAAAGALLALSRLGQVPSAHPHITTDAAYPIVEAVELGSADLRLVPAWAATPRSDRDRISRRRAEGGRG